MIYPRFYIKNINSQTDIFVGVYDKDPVIFKIKDNENLKNINSISDNLKNLPINNLFTSYNDVSFLDISPIAIIDNDNMVIGNLQFNNIFTDEENNLKKK